MSFPEEEPETTGVTPRQTMRGHTHWIRGVAHLPGGQRTMTCSLDGTLRLWDMESGGQIGNEWQDGDTAMYAIALSPNGKTVASGSDDGIVRLWDVEMGKVVSRWTGHTEGVQSVCWSGDGERVMSGSRDGTAREWDALGSGNPILGAIKTGHESVLAVIYSPDSTKFATSGYNLHESVKIWDTKTAELVQTLKQPFTVHSLAWTSDNNKLISGSYRSIRIFDTATWDQIAILEGHKSNINAISLSSNDRILASASRDKTLCLWNLDRNLQVGPPLQHQNIVSCAAFSADARLLVTGCDDSNTYVWDTHAILNQAGLDYLLPVMDGDATSHPPHPLLPDDPRDSSATPAPHRRRWSPRVLLDGLSSLFRRSYANTDERDPKLPTVSRRPKRDKTQPAQQQKGQAQTSSSQTQPAAASMSPTSPTPATGITQPPPLSLWARFVFILCRASPAITNGHQIHTA